LALALRIVTGGSVPIYRQIQDQICQAIVTGALQEGEQLPSVRALAEDLVVNPNTIARTYGDLVREGILEAQKGKGFFVARRRVVYTKAERARRIQESLDAFVSQSLVLGLSAKEVLGLVEEKLRRLEGGPSGRGGEHRGES